MSTRVAKIRSIKKIKNKLMEIVSNEISAINKVAELIIDADPDACHSALMDVCRLLIECEEAKEEFLTLSGLPGMDDQGVNEITVPVNLIASSSYYPVLKKEMKLFLKSK